MTHATPGEPWASEHIHCLAKLNHEHREGLLFAKEIASTAETGDAIAQAVKRIRDYNSRELSSLLGYRHHFVDRLYHRPHGISALTLSKCVTFT